MSEWFDELAQFRRIPARYIPPGTETSQALFENLGEIQSGTGSRPLA